MSSTPAVTAATDRLHAALRDMPEPLLTALATVALPEMSLAAALRDEQAHGRVWDALGDLMETIAKEKIHG